MDIYRNQDITISVYSFLSFSFSGGEKRTKRGCDAGLTCTETPFPLPQDEFVRSVLDEHADSDFRVHDQGLEVF